MEISDIEREVENLHIFFEEWYKGNCELKSFERAENALAEEFTLVSPDGRIHDRQSIIESIKSSYGSTPNRTIRAFVKEVQNIGDHYLVVYEEVQKKEDNENKRISTAIFNPYGQWIHVHETWVKPN